MNVIVEARYDRLERMTRDYEVSQGEPIMTLSMSEGEIAAMRQGRNPFMQRLSSETIEHYCTGQNFNYAILELGGFVLHSSAVAVDGEAYLFSGDCNVGKSTHAALWLKHFGERAAMINDDKPIIRRMDGVFNAYGTPWCGEKNIGNNIKAPLKAIAFLERSNENSIERMEPKEAFDRLFRQTLHRIASKSGIDALLVQLDELIKAVPIYVLRCSISDEAVKAAYGAMSERASE